MPKGANITLLGLYPYTLSLFILLYLPLFQWRNCLFQNKATYIRLSIAKKGHVRKTREFLCRSSNWGFPALHPPKPGSLCL